MIAINTERSFAGMKTKNRVKIFTQRDKSCDPAGARLALASVINSWAGMFDCNILNVQMETVQKVDDDFTLESYIEVCATVVYESACR